MFISFYIMSIFHFYILKNMYNPKGMWNEICEIIMDIITNIAPNPPICTKEALV